jgi:hypothetical protein
VFFAASCRHASRWSDGLCRRALEFHTQLCHRYENFDTVQFFHLQMAFIDWPAEGKFPLREEQIGESSASKLTFF